jgi:UrcA family protein
MRHLTNTAAIAAILSALALTAGPAAAQSVSEVTVSAAKGNDVQALSYKVGYADLNLRETAGRKTLHERIAVTARYLCRSLGEANRVSFNACRDRAVADAMPAARAAVRDAHARQYVWTPGPTWTPPGA